MPPISETHYIEISEGEKVLILLNSDCFRIQTASCDSGTTFPWTYSDSWEEKLGGLFVEGLAVICGETLAAIGKWSVKVSIR